MTTLAPSHQMRQPASHSETFPNASPLPHKTTRRVSELSTSNLHSCPQSVHDARQWDDHARQACGIAPGALLPSATSPVWRQYVAAYDSARITTGTATTHTAPSPQPQDLRAVIAILGGPRLAAMRSVGMPATTKDSETLPPGAMGAYTAAYHRYIRWAGGGRAQNVAQVAALLDLLTPVERAQLAECAA